MAETFKINGIDYECEFKLSNPDNQEISFTKSAIRGMTLIDNVFEPFMSGSISIANPYDFIENKYFLRGDGRDEIVIKFKPVEKKWGDYEEFEHTFVITDDSDIANPIVRSENIKTFSLVAKEAIVFSDMIPYNKVYSGKIGQILMDIFKELLGEELVDDKNWELGDFDITYYVPSTFRYMDLIRYFLRIYYAKDDEIYVKGFISYDNTSKKYRLDLLSKIYKDHKKHEMEAFAIGDLVTDVDFNNPNNPPSGPKVGEYIGGIKNLGYSTPQYGWTTDYFINSLVFGYDNNLGEMKIKKIDFEEIKKKWEKKFVEPFKSKSGSPKSFAIKNNSTDKKFKRYKFPYPIEHGIKIVEAEIHNALTFYNLQLSFSNIGCAARNSGMFLDIFSPKKLKNPMKDALKSDEKILGRWYITEIRHIFYGDLYTNQIFATKTYIGPNAKIDENVD
jgi:hypothetical protein